MDKRIIRINNNISDKEYMLSDVEEVIIGSKVRKIGNRAFAFCKQLKKIVFECKSVELGYECFCYCEKLKTICLPKMNHIPYRCFFASGLTSITFPNNLIGIDAEAFCYCHFKKLNFPSSLKTIGSEAFLSAGSLETIDFKNIEKLSDYSFACTKIERIKLGRIIEIIPYMCFNKCDLKYVEILPTEERDTLYENARDIIKLDRYSFANNPNMTIKMPEEANGYEETFWVNNNPYFMVYIKEPYKNMKILLPNSYLKYLGSSKIIYYSNNNIKVEGY